MRGDSHGAGPSNRAAAACGVRGRPRLALAAALAVLTLALASGCAADNQARTDRVEIGAQARVRDIDTRSEALQQAPRLDRTSAERLNVNTTYGALDRNAARLGLVVLLVLTGFLCVALAADGPSDPRHKLYLFAAGGAALAVAVGMGYAFFA